MSKKAVDRPEPPADEPGARFCRPILIVELSEPRPNPMFTEAQRSLVRFIRYFEHGKPKKVACAHCGHKKAILWTQLCSFKVGDIKDSFGPIFKPEDKVYPPLTAVCSTHILAPQTEEVDREGNVIPEMPAAPEANPDAVNP